MKKIDEIKKKITLPLAAAVLILFVGATTMQYTSFMTLSSWPRLFNSCRKLALLLACGKIALNVLGDFWDGASAGRVRDGIKNVWRQNIILLLFLFLSLLVSHYAGKKDLFFLLIVLGAMRGVPFSFILKWYLTIQIILLVLVVGAALTGMIPNMKLVRDETKMRYGMGYDYPSVTMTMVFFIWTAYAWKKSSHASVAFMGIFLAVTVWLFCETDARMGFLASLVVLVSIAVCKKVVHWQGKNRDSLLQKGDFWRVMGRAAACVNDTLPFLLFVFVVIACLCYPEAAWARWLDDCINKRIRYGSEALGNYGVPLFGQVIQWVGYGGEYAGELQEGVQYNFVDCSYLQMLVQYGIVWTAAVLAAFSILLRTLRRQKAWYSLFLTWVILGYCFIEPRLLEIHADIFLCLFVPFLFPWDRTRPKWDGTLPQELPQNYFVAEQRAHEHHAGAKARNDIAQILYSDGWTPLSVTRGDGKGTADKLRMCVVVVLDWAGILVASDSGVPILVQYPLATYPMVRSLALPFLVLLKYVKRNPIYYLVHDIESMRLNVQGEQKREMRFFRLADGIISHNAKMTEYLRTMGVTCLVTEIEIFDYLTQIPLPQKKRPMNASVAVAGNLNREKAGYLYEMEKRNSSIDWQVYGPNFEGTGKGCLNYRGQFPAEQLPGQFEAAFGLVWDGDSCETCAGLYGAYLRFNNPHKLSLYLASGMPVIVWRESALAKWVEENQVGFAVSSLYEMEEQIHQITPEQYAQWQEHVYEMANELRKGAHTLRAAEKIIGK